jgi:ribosomal protein L37AE/L43A
MKCQFCQQSSASVTRLCVYTRRGIWVCKECYDTIDRYRRQPYSKIMDRLALLEAGYYVNRKLALERR